MGEINLLNFQALCKDVMNWSQEYVEERFHGSRKELIEFLNSCEELEKELFFSGFFCENPVVALACDGNIDIKNLSTPEKVQIFINRGKTLCSLTNNKPGFVVKSYRDND